MELFEERIDTINYLLNQNKISEAFDEYRTLVLMVNRLYIDRFDILKKTKHLGDHIFLKILKEKIKDPIRIKEAIDLRSKIEEGKFNEILKQHHQICELINQENFLDALKKFKKC